MRKIDYSSSEVTNNRVRTWLTIILVGLGLLSLLIIGFEIIKLADKANKFESSKWVFNAIIPLIASWIGTILAFHFGRENYEAATKNALALNKDIIQEIKVENIMIDVKTIFYQKVDPDNYDKVILDELIKEYIKAEKDRILIFSSNFNPEFIIHRSTLAEYLNLKDSQTRATLSLGVFIKENKNKFSFETEGGFAIVAKDDSVKEAFIKMNSIKGCQDVIITDSGNQKGKVIGWLTNTLINRFLTIE
jgi:hypothetical protein